MENIEAYKLAVQQLSGDLARFVVTVNALSLAVQERDRQITALNALLDSKTQEILDLRVELAADAESAANIARDGL